MFYHIGQQISHGYLPYRDVWEHKPPIAFYIFAAVLKISNTNAALIVLSLMWTFLTAYVMYLLARELFDERKAQIAACIFAFAANVHRFTQGGNQTEIYMLLFIVGLYYLALRFYKTRQSGYLLAAGLCWGIGFQTKPVAIFSGLAVGVFILYDWFVRKD
jgi:4-amino-4-deoxy-L-arabinose transferase-like glycosyltransferase